MATDKGTIDFIVEQIEDAGRISCRKMFGEYALYCGDKVVALVCDEQLFVKPTDAGRTFVDEVTEGFPFPGAKPWLLISGDRWDNREWLTELIRITAAALPPPKPKKPRAKKR